MKRVVNLVVLFSDLGKTAHDHSGRVSGLPKLHLIGTEPRFRTSWASTTTASSQACARAEVPLSFISLPFPTLTPSRPRFFALKNDPLFFIPSASHLLSLHQPEMGNLHCKVAACGAVGVPVGYHPTPTPTPVESLPSVDGSCHPSLDPIIPPCPFGDPKWSSFSSQRSRTRNQTPTMVANGMATLAGYDRVPTATFGAGEEVAEETLTTLRTVSVPIYTAGPGEEER